MIVSFSQYLVVVLILLSEGSKAESISTRYSYDTLGRLITATYGTEYRIDYSYDPASNRTSYIATAPSVNTSESVGMTSGAIPNISISNVGGAGASYEWYRDGMKISTTGVPNLVLSESSPQHAGNYRVIVKKADGTISTVELMVKLTGLTYESWLKHKQFPTATPADPGLARMASARNDGIENILKYAFGKGPNEAANDRMPKAIWTGSGANRRLALSYQKIFAPLDIRYKIEASADLKEWRNVTALMTMVGTPIATVDGLSEEVTYECPIAVLQSEARDWKFLRVAVEASTPEVIVGPSTPEISVEPSGGSGLVDGSGIQDLGSVMVGKSGTAMTFVIRNTGKSDLNGLAITKNGSHSSDFVVTAPLITSVPQGAFTTFTVTFLPSASGRRTAAIQIASNDADENPFRLNFAGTGSLTKLKLEPEIDVQQPAGTSLVDGIFTNDFGKVKKGKIKSKTFTIRNTGTENLTGLLISKSGAGRYGFKVAAPGIASLAPGATTTFKVTFKPFGKKRLKAALHIKSNDENENPFDINLTGTGITTK